MYLQLQFEYEYFEILCIFSFDFNTVYVNNFAAGPIAHMEKAIQSQA